MICSCSTNQSLAGITRQSSGLDRHYRWAALLTELGVKRSGLQPQFCRFWDLWINHLTFYASLSPCEMELKKFTLHPSLLCRWEIWGSESLNHLSYMMQLLNGRTTRYKSVLLIKIYAKENTVIICAKAVFRIPPSLDFNTCGLPFPLLEFWFPSPQFQVSSCSSDAFTFPHPLPYLSSLQSAALRSFWFLIMSMKLSCMLFQNTSS